MTVAANAQSALALSGAPGRPPGFAVRFAWRDLRGGLRGFGVFIACIALGVLAIAGVGSVAASLNEGIAKAGRVILGGDLAFSFIQREADDTERAFLTAHGTVSAAATLRAMARPLTDRPAAATGWGTGRSAQSLNGMVKGLDVNPGGGLIHWDRVMAAEYEAELKTLALEQTRAKISLDDSRLSEIKKAFEQLREKIDVQRQTVELAERFNEGSLGEKKSETTKDAVEEAREYLGGEKAKGNEAKK